MGELAGGCGSSCVGPTGRKEEELRAGAPAPASGTYETVNLFGRRTGHLVSMQQGDLLPSLPRGFTWIAVRAEEAPGD